MGFDQIGRIEVVKYFKINNTFAKNKKGFIQNLFWVKEIKRIAFTEHFFVI